MELVWRNTLPSQATVTNVVYIPQENAIISSDKNNFVRFYEASTGSVIRSSRPTDFKASVQDGKMILQYFEPIRSLLIAWDHLVNVRRHCEDIILIDDILEAPIKNPESRVRLELTSEQSTLFKTALLLDTDTFEQFERNGLRIVSTKGRSCQLTQWETITIEGPYSVLAAFARSMMVVQKGNDAKLLPVAASICSRLLRLILRDDILVSLCYWQSKALMNIEQFRRISFCSWPHMDYQWATPEAMAAAGFYKMVLDTLDRVFCFRCEICLTNWEPTDEPWTEHHRHSSNCDFVQFKPSSNVSFNESRITESARLHDISTSPIEVISTGSSEEFIVTSTRTGDVTIWDVSVYLRKSLDFKLTDLLSVVCERKVQVHELEVHSACIMRPSSLSQPVKENKAMDESCEPAEHHVLLGCRLDSSLSNELRSSSWYANQSKRSLRTDSATITQPDSCVLVVRVYPPNIMGFISQLRRDWYSKGFRILLPSSANAVSRHLQDEGFIPKDLVLSYHSGENETLESSDETPQVGAEDDGSIVPDRLSPYDEENGDHESPITQATQSVTEKSDAHNDNGLQQSVVQPKASLDFYRALGLQHLIDPDPINSPIIARTPSQPEDSWPFSNFPDVPSSPHPEKKKQEARNPIDPYCPQMIEMIELPPYLASNRIIQLCPISTPFDANLFKPVGQDSMLASTYNRGVLICVGKERVSSKTISKSQISEAQSGSGGLLFFGYDPCGKESIVPFFSVEPLLQIPFMNDCPIQVCMISMAAKSDALSCTSDSDCPISPVYSNSTLLEETRQTNLPCDLYARCLVLTENSCLHQIDISAKPIVSHRIHCVWNGAESDSCALPITCMAYCEDTDCVCFGDQNGVSMYHYLPRNDRIDAFTNADGIASDKQIARNKQLLTCAPNIWDNLINLEQITRSEPLDMCTRTHIISSTGWSEISLSDDQVRKQVFVNNDRVPNRRRKNAVSSLTNTTGGTQLPSHCSAGDGGTGDAADCDTIQVISRFVTRQLMTKSETIKQGGDSVNSCLCNVGLTAQLALTGACSTHVWESRPEKKLNLSSTMTKVPDSVARGSEIVLEVSLPRTCSISHFGLHLSLSDAKVNPMPFVYVTLLRSSTSTMHTSSDADVTATVHSPAESVPSDPDLMVDDLQAPFIDDETAECSEPSSAIHRERTPGYGPTCKKNSGFYDTFPYVFGRTCYFPHGHPLPSTRLRELGGEILAGPYLITNNSDENKQNFFIPLTSPDLIKCRTRLFAIHLRIMGSKTSMVTEKQSRLSTLFSLIGLTVHRFSRATISTLPTIASTPVPSSSTNAATNQPMSSPVAKTIPYERAERLALLRSTTLHESLIRWLASPITERIRAVRHLHPQHALCIVLDLLTWIVNMYHHELHLPNLILKQLFECHAGHCKNVVENLLVVGDRQIVQMSTTLIFMLLSLESRWVLSDTKAQPVFHASLLQTLLQGPTCDEADKCVERFSRLLLSVRCSAGAESLVNLLSVLLLNESGALSNELAQPKTRHQIGSTIAGLLRTLLRMMQCDEQKQLSFTQLPQFASALHALRIRYGFFYHYFDDPFLFDLRLSQWSHLGPNALISSRILRTQDSGDDNSAEAQVISNSNEWGLNNTSPEVQQLFTNFKTGENNGDSPSSSINMIAALTPYAEFVAGADVSPASNVFRAHVTNPNTSSEDMHLLPLAFNGHLSDTEPFYVDWISLLRSSQTSSPIDSVHKLRLHSLLPELQDVSTRGLLDVEPLRVTQEASLNELPADCSLERVNLFTGIQIPALSQKHMETSECSVATQNLWLPPEAYHLLVSRMHAGAHRKIILAFHPSGSVDSARTVGPVHLLTDLIIPVNPLLTSITVEALMSEGVAAPFNANSTPRLIALYTEIGQRPLILRDLTPPVPFTRLRITISARLDCQLTRARIHLGAFFGRSGSLDCSIREPDASPNRIQSWELAWAIGQPFLCTTKTSIDQSEITNSNALFNELERLQASTLATIKLTQSELISCLPVNGGIAESSNLDNSRNQFRLDRRVLTLYTQYFVARCQFNWLKRFSDRLLRSVYPHADHGSQNEITSLTLSGLIGTLNSDKLRNLAETILCFLTAHSNYLGNSVAFNNSCLTDSARCLIETEELYDMAHSLIRVGSNSAIRVMQVLSVGLSSLLLGLWYSKISVDDLHLGEFKDTRLLDLMEILCASHSDQCPNLSCLCCTRRIFAFWALIHRLLIAGFADHLLAACLYRIRTILKSWNSSHSKPLALVSLLFNTIYEVSCSGSQLSQPDNFMHLVWTRALDTLRADQTGLNAIGLHGLLIWYYTHQSRNPIECSSSTSCDTRTVNSFSGIEQACVNHHQLCFSHRNRLVSEANEMLNHGYHFPDNELFPVGASFVHKLRKERMRSLLQSLNALPVPELNDTPASKMRSDGVIQSSVMRYSGHFSHLTLTPALCQSVRATLQTIIEALTSALVPETSSFEPPLFLNLCSMTGQLMTLLPTDVVRSVLVSKSGDSFISLLLRTIGKNITHSDCSSMSQLLLHGFSLILGTAKGATGVQSVDRELKDPVVADSTDQHPICFHCEMQISEVIGTRLKDLWPIYCKQMYGWLPHRAACSVLHQKPARSPTSPAHTVSQSRCAVLWDIIAKHFTRLCTFENLSETLHLYLMIFGEAKFEPSKFFSTEQPLVFNKDTLQVLLDRIVDACCQNVDDCMAAPTSDDSSALTMLALRFFAAIISTSESLCSYLLVSEQFARFFDALLKRPVWQSDYSSPVFVRAVQVLFTCFAFTRTSSNFQVHPFDEFCAARLLRLCQSSFFRGDQHGGRLIDWTWLHDLLIVVTYKRLIQPNNDKESIQLQPIGCAPHTIHATSQQSRSALIIGILTYLQQCLDKDSNTCYDQLLTFTGTQATLLDDLFEWSRTDCAVWTVKSITDSEAQMPYLTSCCLFTLLPSSILSDTTQLISCRLLTLSRMFCELISNLDFTDVPSESFVQSFFDKLFHLLSLSRMMPSICHMATLASLKNGWVTLNCFAHQLLSHMRPITVTDNLLCGAYTFFSKHQWVRKGVLEYLINHPSRAISCPLLLLLALCQTDFVDKTRLFQLGVRMFDAVQIDFTRFTTGMRPFNTLSHCTLDDTFGSGAFQLSQVLISQASQSASLIHASQTSNILSLSLPAGLSAPLPFFGDASLAYWQRVCQLPCPPPAVPLKSCCDQFVRKEPNLALLPPPIDFTPVSWFHSEVAEKKLVSMVASAEANEWNSGAFMPYYGHWEKWQSLYNTDLTKRPLDVPGIACGLKQFSAESQTPEAKPILLLDADKPECTVDLTVRFPCLVWLQRIEVRFCTGSLYECPRGVLVELYRGLVASTRQNLVATFSSTGFQLSNQSVRRPLLLSSSNPFGRHPNHVVLDFEPCLTTHILIRFYRPIGSHGILALDELRLLGHHVDSIDWSQTQSVARSEVSSVSSSIALLHVLHNHVFYDAVPKKSITSFLVDRLLWQLLAATIQPNQSVYEESSSPVAATEIPSRDIVSSLTESEISSDWLSPLNQDCSKLLDLFSYSVKSSSATSLSERILIRLMAAYASSTWKVLDLVLSRLLFETTSIDPDAFQNAIEHTDSEMLDTMNETFDTCFAPIGATFASHSSPVQRLFTCFCLSEDPGQSYRLAHVLRWLERVCCVKDTSQTNPIHRLLPLAYTTQLFVVLAGVLWRLGGGPVCRETTDWKTKLTADLVLCVHSMCMHVWKIAYSNRSVDGVQSFGNAVGQVLCALCAILPDTGVALLSDLINNGCQPNHSDKLSFEAQLRVINYVVRADAVVLRLMSHANSPLEGAPVECCLSNCCDWLNEYFLGQQKTVTDSNTTVLAIRRLRVITTLLSAEQPDLLRRHLAQLVCPRLLSTLFNHYDQDLHSIHSGRCTAMPPIARDQLRTILSDLCYAIGSPLWFSNVDQSAVEEQQHQLASLIKTYLNQVKERREPNIPDILQCIILRTLRPLSWVHPVAVFWLPTENQRGSISYAHELLTGPPLCISLTSDVNSSCVVSFITHISRELIASRSQVHDKSPSVNQAILMINVVDNSNNYSVSNSPKNKVDVGQLRVAVATFTHSAGRMPVHFTSVNDFAASASLSHLEMAASRHFPLPGQKLCDLWKEAVPLPQGATDRWTVEELVHLLHGSSRNGHEPIALLVRQRSINYPCQPAEPIPWERKAQELNLSPCPSDPLRFSFLSTLVGSGVLRSLVDCMFQLLRSHNTVLQPSTVSSQNQPRQSLRSFEGPSNSDISSRITASKSWLNFLSSVCPIRSSLSFPTFAPSVQLFSSAPTSCPNPIYSDTVPLHHIPTHIMLAYLLFLRLDGYAVSLMQTSSHLSPDTGQFTADLFSSLLNLAHRSPLKQMSLMDYTIDNEHSALRNTDDSTIASAMRILPFYSLSELYHNRISDRTVPVHTTVREHIEGGVLELIVTFLHSLVFRSTKSSIPLNLSRDETSLISAARLEYERDLAAFTSKTVRYPDRSNFSYLAKGTGFAFGSSESRWNTDVTLLKTKREDSDATVLVHSLLSFLKLFCFSSSSSEAQMNDGTVIHTVSRILAEFGFSHVLISYLRNQSALDLDNRISLYRALFLLIRVIVHVPALHWVLVTGSDNSDLQDLVEACAKLHEIWSANKVPLPDVEVTDQRPLPDHLPQDCPARLLNDINQILSVYEAQLRKLGLSRPDTRTKAANPRSGSSRRTLVRQKSIRYRNRDEHRIQLSATFSSDPHVSEVSETEHLPVLPECWDTQFAPGELSQNDFKDISTDSDKPDEFESVASLAYCPSLEEQMSSTEPGEIDAAKFGVVSEEHSLASNDKNQSALIENKSESDEQLGVLLSELRSTVALVKIAVNAFYTTRSKLFPGEAKQSGSRDYTTHASSTPSDLSVIYCERLRPLQFGMMEMLRSPVDGKVTATVPHNFLQLAAHAEGLKLTNPEIGSEQWLFDETDVNTTSASQMMLRARRLAQEIVTLSTGLPLSEHSSVFVRVDENNSALIKALLTGPSNTPYANGCFLFDVFIPTEYPNEPPKVQLMTTGNNTVQFNPNLYSTGMVCLSILNTWQGAPEENWNSATSSLLQVLVSIQSLILVAEPYFNEPGTESGYGKSNAVRNSNIYNVTIRNHTVRWAILEQLRHPPAGFEAVVLNHFQLKKQEILTQIENWIEECSAMAGFVSETQTLKLNFAALKKEFTKLDSRLAAWNKEASSPKSP